MCVLIGNRSPGTAERGHSGMSGLMGSTRIGRLGTNCVVTGRRSVPGCGRARLAPASRFLIRTIVGLDRADFACQLSEAATWLVIGGLMVA